MNKIKIYEIDATYIKYLSTFEQHLFRNKKISQSFSRKYVGVLLEVNGFNYFAPLSSYKPKHKSLMETVDFIKIGSLAVININNMFPAPLKVCKPVIFSSIKDEHYRNLIRAEYRIIKQKSNLLIQNVSLVYNHKLLNDGKSKLSQRCNNFQLLEEKCREWK